VIGENKGCFSVHSENSIREADVHFKYGWIPDIEGFSGQRSLKIGTEVGGIEIFSMPDIWTVGSLAARTQRSTIARATAFLCLILIPSLSSAAIYKCTAQDGGITYTDAPCPADTTTQYIDPASLWLNESSQTMNTAPAFRDANPQSQPE